MFPDTNQKYLTNLQEKAKRKAIELKKCRLTGQMTFAATAKIDAATDTMGVEAVGTCSAKSSARSALLEGARSTFKNIGNLEQTYSAAKARKSNVEKVTRKLTIIERLSLAHQETMMERRLDISLASSKSSKETDRMSRIQYLKTNFPSLTESVGGDNLSATDAVQAFEAKPLLQRMMSQSNFERKDVRAVMIIVLLFHISCSKPPSCGLRCLSWKMRWLSARRKRKQMWRRRSSTRHLQTSTAFLPR
jgi:hypothetical protein